MSRRVLYINHSSQIGGAERSLLLIVKHLPRYKFIPIVSCPPQGRLVEELNQFAVSVEAIDFHRVRRTADLFAAIQSIALFFRYISKLFQVIRQQDVRLVHANSLKSAIMGGFSAKMAGVPLIWHVRDFLPVGRLRRFLILVAYCLANTVIVNSSAVGMEVENQVGRVSKIVLIHNAMDLEKFRAVCSKEVAKAILGIGLYSTVLGTIGRIHPEKGLEYLVRAIHKVVKAIPKIQLLVVGDTTLGDKEYYQSIKDLVKRLDLQDAIVFLGYQKDVAKVLTTFDIFVLPSLKEPFGLVTLEAMAMAKPVIATNTGGTPEIVIDGQTGILVPPRNVDALADAIMRLLRDEELAKKMGLAGRARVHECFSVEKMMKKIEDVYEGVLTGRRTRKS